jgi:large subunit ribosomal protein L24
MKIHKGDKVQITVGKDKGRSAEVVASFPKSHTVIVKGLNLYKRHLKPVQGRNGGIVEKEREINVSKVALVCPNCQKVSKVGYHVDKSGQKTRFCKKCSNEIMPVTKQK